MKQFLKKKELYSFPARSGGLGIPLFSEKTCNEIENSLTITAPLVALITQGTSLPNAAEIKKSYSTKKGRTTYQKVIKD